QVEVEAGALCYGVDAGTAPQLADVETRAWVRGNVDGCQARHSSPCCMHSAGPWVIAPRVAAWTREHRLIPHRPDGSMRHHSEVPVDGHEVITLSEVLDQSSGTLEVADALLADGSRHKQSRPDGGDA